MNNQKLTTGTLEDSATLELPATSDSITGVLEVAVISVPEECKPTFTVIADGKTRTELHRQIRGLIFQKYGRQPGGAKHSWSAVLIETETSL